MTIGTALVLIALGFALYRLPVLRKIVAAILGLGLVAALIVGPYLWYQDRQQTAMLRELAAQQEEVERAFYKSQKLFSGRTITLEVKWSTPHTPAPPGIHKFDWNPERHWMAHSRGGSGCEVTWYAPVSEVEGEDRKAATGLGRQYACMAYDRCFGSGDDSLIEPCARAVAAGREFTELSEAQKAAAREELRRAKEEEQRRRAKAVRMPEANRSAEAAPSTTPSASRAQAFSLFHQGSYEAAAQAFSLALGLAAEGRFSIQVFVTCAPETLQKVTTAVPAAEELFILPVNYKGRPCYRLCWGVYDGRAAAEVALSGLPSYLRQGGATPRLSPLAELLPSGP